MRKTFGPPPPPRFELLSKFLPPQAPGINNAKHYRHALFFAAKRRKIFGIKEILIKKFISDAPLIFSTFGWKGVPMVLSLNFYGVEKNISRLWYKLRDIAPCFG